MRLAEAACEVRRGSWPIAASAHKLYRVLSEELKFDFVIRFRGNIAVTATDDEARAAADWVGAGGRARTRAVPRSPPGVSGRHRGLRAGERHERAAAPCGQHCRRPARALIKLYAKRWESRAVSATQRIFASDGALIDACQHARPARPPVAINAFAVALLRSWAPQENNWATIGTSRPTRPSDALIRAVGQHALRTHAKHDRFSPAATHKRRQSRSQPHKGERTAGVELNARNALLRELSPPVGRSGNAT